MSVFQDDMYRTAPDFYLNGRTEGDKGTYTTVLFRNTRLRPSTNLNTDPAVKHGRNIN